VSDPLNSCSSNDIILDGYCSGISKYCIPNNKEKESVLDFVYILENSANNDSIDTKTSISDFRSALSHYRGRSGKTVIANPKFITHIENDKFSATVDEL